MGRTDKKDHRRAPETGGTAKISVRRTPRVRSFLSRGLLVLFVAAVLLAAGLYWLSSSPLLAVERVVASKTTYVTSEEIAAATGPAAGDNLLRVPLEDLERRLRSIPHVREASVHRRYPDAIEVRLTEYQPVALMRLSADSVMAVSDDGRILGPASEESLPLMVPAGDIALEPGEFLPRIVRDALPVAEKVSVADTDGEIRAADSVHVGAAGEVTLVLDSGTEIRLGEPTRLDSKFTVAAEILKRYSRDGRVPAYIDVHVPERAVARPHGGTEESAE